MKGGKGAPMIGMGGGLMLEIQSVEDESWVVAF